MDSRRDQEKEGKVDENEEDGDRSPEVVLGFPCQRWIMGLAEVLGGGPEGSMKQHRPEEKQRRG